MSNRIPPNLRPGIRVLYFHIRYYDSDPLVPSEKGGVTCAFRLEDKEQHLWHVAIAECNVVDNFNKRLGRLIATNRLNWGDCHALKLDYTDPSSIKEVVDKVREYVMAKCELITEEEIEDDPPSTVRREESVVTIH